MVQCPICGNNVPLDLINSHLDICEKSSQEVKEEITATNVDGSKSDPTTTDSPEIIEIKDNDEADGLSSEPLRKKFRSALDMSQVRSIGDILGSQRKKQQQAMPYTQTTVSKQQLPLMTTTNTNSQVSSPPSQADEIKKLKANLHKPLPERLRPNTLTEYVGQQHLLGPEGILRNLITSNQLPSMILWGPPGVGKTTLARIISKVHKENKFIELNATNSGTAQIRTIFENSIKEMKLTGRKTIVFIDEIHRFNKSQQDTFLPFVESGAVKIIGATTENPSFQLNNALLSRCKVFQLEKLTVDDIRSLINRGILYLNKVRKLVLDMPILVLEKNTIDHISSISNGDSRISLNVLELINGYFKSPPTDGKITVEHIKPILSKLPTLYDRSGDFHYDAISAFHKSIRGSNVNAGLWYLAIMLKNGEDPLYIARRMIVIASEDVGVADETCLPFAIATYQAIQFVGLPEAQINMAHCVVKLASAPKSTKSYRAWNAVKKMMDGEMEKFGVTNGMDIPLHLKNAPTRLMKELGYGENYKYNPDFKDGKVKQRYFANEFLESYDFYGKAKHLGDYADPDL